MRLPWQLQPISGTHPLITSLDCCHDATMRREGPKYYFINSPSPSAVYIFQPTGSTLVEVTGDKPLPEPMLTFLSIGPLGTNFSEIWITLQNFSFMKMHLKCHLQNGGHFVRGRWVKWTLDMLLFGLASLAYTCHVIVITSGHLQ